MKKILDISFKYPLMLLFVIMLSVSCERPWVAPWPPDGARLPDDVWENYQFARGFLDRAWMEAHYSANFNDLHGGGHTASASDEAKHTVPTGRANWFTSGVWSPSRTVPWRYGGAYRNYIREPWQTSFVAVRRVNIFLENLDNSIIINDPAIPAREFERDHYRGMAYFIRAWAMWEVFQKYGAFPIITEPLDFATDDIFIPRNTMQECYDFIMSDLDSAYKYLPWFHDANNWHRPTKTYAEAIRARLQLYWASPLYQGDHSVQPFGLEAGETGDITRWENVIETVRRFFNENDYYNMMQVTRWTNQPLSPAVSGAVGTYTNRIYYTTVATSPVNTEVIWSTVQTTQMRPTQHEWELNNLPDGVVGARGHTNPTQEMVDAYEVVPLRPNSHRPEEGAVSEPFDWDNPDHAENPYANRDPRFYHAILFNGVEWGTTAGRRWTAQLWEGGQHNNPARPNATKTGYYMRKGLSESFHSYETGGFGASTRQRHQFRVPELLLIYAEAMNVVYGPDADHPDGPMRPILLGSTPYDISSARDAINMIRDRVEMPQVPAGLTQEDFFEWVVHERRIELGFEGHRMFDLRRWKMGEILGEPIHGIRINSQDPDTPGEGPWNYEVFHVEDRVWEDKMYWWPLPYDEIVKAQGRLEQNPEW